ncbi:NXPE family member 3-like isoform X2 [Marmota marmota marmota]|uniref:NXPE family member 3-like isoform X2 n=1 Tax=Marmota marmota marmota TaxID=9994 RepID=UPI000762A6D0|nr:NXPE family member 3-like isoform X2 [Marmota marmota marmota]
MSNKELQVSTGPYLRHFRWHKILVVVLAIVFWVLYFRIFWSGNSDPWPPKSPSADKDPTSLSLELPNLIHLLYWPLTPGDGGDLLASTSHKTSTYHLRGPSQDTYALGSYLEVVLVARDHRGRPKTHGGDLFQARLLGPELRAGVPGDVQDLENGTYLLSFPLLWAGRAQVQVRLIHSSEAIGVLRRIWTEHWATVDFIGYFRGPRGDEESVSCNVNPLLIREEKSFCYYKDEDSGEFWYCDQPPTLACSMLVGHSVGHYWNVTTSHEEALLAWNLTDKVLPQGIGPVHVARNTSRSLALKPVDLHSIYQVGPLMAVETTRGIVLHWRAHSWPLRSKRTPVASLHSVVRELGGLAGGPHTVVVLGLGAHFTTFPPSIFARRLAGIRAAVMALLEREPRTLVVIKLANTGYKSVYGSDWFTLHMNRLLRSAFAGLRVAFVDAWEMTSSLALPDNIHPGKLIVSNEVNLLLSFICPT